MNYVSEFCILNINLTVIVNLEHRTVITRANLLSMVNYSFTSLLTLSCSLTSLLTQTGSLFALSSVPFKVWQSEWVIDCIESYRYFCSQGMLLHCWTILNQVSFTQLSFLKTGPHTHTVTPAGLWYPGQPQKCNLMLGKVSPGKHCLTLLCGLIPNLQIWDSVTGTYSWLLVRFSITLKW